MSNVIGFSQSKLTTKIGLWWEEDVIAMEYRASKACHKMYPVYELLQKNII
jgi:hypothetical protein